MKEFSKFGDQGDPSTLQGPQVAKGQYERILLLVDVGVSEGATLIKGERAHTDTRGKGFYISPTVLTDFSSSMRIYREESLGPFAVIGVFPSEEEAIDAANDTAYGSGTAVFTEDLQRTHRVAAEVEAGMVWINSGQDCDFRIPFGGVKHSGIGRDLGEVGLEACMQFKAVPVNMGNNIWMIAPDVSHTSSLLALGHC